MVKSIMKCLGCGGYTLKEQCSSCSAKTVVPKPVKYSPEDNYASYRRKAKGGQLKEKGWL